MANLQKGYISTIEGTTARVVPDEEPETVTPALGIHASIRGDLRKLKKGTAVIFVVFPDRTGLVLCRADGEVYGENP